MKKILLILVAVLYSTSGIYAQKFAYVDTDYILNKIPEFKQTLGLLYSQPVVEDLSNELLVEHAAKKNKVSVKKIKLFIFMFSDFLILIY